MLSNCQALISNFTDNLFPKSLRLPRSDTLDFKQGFVHQTAYASKPTWQACGQPEASSSAARQHHLEQKRPTAMTGQKYNGTEVGEGHGRVPRACLQVDRVFCPRSHSQSARFTSGILACRIPIGGSALDHCSRFRGNLSRFRLHNRPSEQTTRVGSEAAGEGLCSVGFRRYRSCSSSRRSTSSLPPKLRRRRSDNSFSTTVGRSPAKACRRVSIRCGVAMSAPMPLSCLLTKLRLRALPGVRLRTSPYIRLRSLLKDSAAALTRALVFSGRGRTGVSGSHSAAATNWAARMGRGVSPSPTA